MRLAIIFISIIFILPHGNAQQLLKGKVYDKQTDSVLVSTTVYNATTKLYALSTRDGDYAIVAKEGDKVVFTSVGYLPDTVKVLNFMIDAGYDITMTLKSSLLKNVTVRGGYQADSIRRRENYAEFYDKSKEKLVSTNGPSNGVGMAFSPIGFFSRRAKDKKMNKKLEYEEEQSFIDYAFSHRYVERSTGLHGDSLQQFMMRYRPTYQFAKTANEEDMLHYINDKLMIYLHHEEAVPPKKKP